MMISVTFRAWFSMYSKKIHKEKSKGKYFGAAYGRSAVLYIMKINTKILIGYIVSNSSLRAIIFPRASVTTFIT